MYDKDCHITESVEIGEMRYDPKPHQLPCLTRIMHMALNPMVRHCYQSSTRNDRWQAIRRIDRVEVSRTFFCPFESSNGQNQIVTATTNRMETATDTTSGSKRHHWVGAGIILGAPAQRQVRLQPLLLIGKHNSRRRNGALRNWRSS